MESLHNSIRLKVTDKCNFSCDFCHKEGGKSGKDVIFTPNLVNILLKIKKDLGINEVHITGGEPLLNDGLVDLIKGIKSLGFKIKATSNGVLVKDFANDMFNSGLKSLNISLHSLELNDFIQFQQSSNLNWGTNMLEKQKEAMAFLKDNNYKFKINTVIRHKKQINQIFEFANLNGYNLRFLHNLGDYYNSQLIIQNFIERVGAILEYSKITPGSSNAVDIYKTKDNFSFGIKK